MSSTFLKFQKIFTRASSAFWQERGNGIKNGLSRRSQELEQENRPADTNSRSDALGEHKLEGLNLNEERVHLGSPVSTLEPERGGSRVSIGSSTRFGWRVT